MVIRMEKPTDIHHGVITPCFHGLKKMIGIQQKMFRDTGRSIIDRYLKIT